MARRRGKAAALRAALCLAALLVQGTLLPLAHADHVPQVRASGIACEAATTFGAAALQHLQLGSSAHDPSSCALCAAFAQSRNGAVRVQLRAPAAPQTVASMAQLLPAELPAAAVPLAAGPRAPPLLFV